METEPCNDQSEPCNDQSESNDEPVDKEENFEDKEEDMEAAGEEGIKDNVGEDNEEEVMSHGVDPPPNCYYSYQKWIIICIAIVIRYMECHKHRQQYHK